MLLARPPTGRELRALARLHRRLPRVEARYLVARAVDAAHVAFSDGRRRQWTLTAVDRIQLRGSPIVLRGPHPTTFVAAPTADELREEMRFNLEAYWTAKAGQRLIWLSDVWVRFGVTTLGRILLTLESGELTSKPAALAWLRGRHPEWAPLLDGRLGRLRRAHAARRFVRERIEEGLGLLDVS